MSHDIQAAWAVSEVVNLFKNRIDECFNNANNLPNCRDLSFYASREGGRRVWPLADGVIMVENTGELFSKIAIEYKRPNEGVHGILTALGQSLAYLHKGYAASIIVIPKKYESHSSAVEHLKSIIDEKAPNAPIGIFSYDEPDTTIANPFNGRIICNRKISLDSVNNSEGAIGRSKSTTQWAHLREGSSDPSAFFRYLQTAKQLSTEELNEPIIAFSPEITQAVESVCNGANPLHYLSNCTGSTLLDYTWRHFWFKYILTEEVMPIYKINSLGDYEVNEVASKILLPDGSRYKMFFAGRSDSIKSKLVSKLKNAEISLADAWIEYIENIKSRAHSYREDLDSGLSHIGLLDVDGRPTDLGYKFVDAVERVGDPNNGTPKAILGGAILQIGQLGALLHYIYKLSETLFLDNPLKYTECNSSTGRYSFLKNDYLIWLERQLAEELNVMRKVSARGGASRQPLQAELAILRQFGYINKFRTGVGLEINWPSIQNSLEFISSLVK